MTFTRLTLLAAAAVFLTACQKLPDTTRAATPVDTKANSLVPGQQYYPVGKAPKDLNTAASPSLLPPGQDLAPHKKAAALMKSLTVHASMNSAWTKVTKALANTRYSIMDKDPSLHVIFVLDRDLTQGRLTRQTPIYKIQLTQQSSTSVSIDLSSGDKHELSSSTKSAVLSAISAHLSS